MYWNHLPLLGSNFDNAASTNEEKIASNSKQSQDDKNIDANAAQDQLNLTPETTLSLKEQLIKVEKLVNRWDMRAALDHIVALVESGDLNLEEISNMEALAERAIHNLVQAGYQEEAKQFTYTIFKMDHEDTPDPSPTYLSLAA